jgi:hypothetical protein
MTKFISNTQEHQTKQKQEGKQKVVGLLSTTSDGHQRFLLIQDFQATYKEQEDFSL